MLLTVCTGPQLSAHLGAERVVGWWDAGRCTGEAPTGDGRGLGQLGGQLLSWMVMMRLVSKMTVVPSPVSSSR